MTEDQQTKREFSAKTLEEATALAAETFGVPAELLDIEVLSEPGSLSSLFGKKARIKAWPKALDRSDELKFQPDTFTKIATGGNGFDPVDALTRIAHAILQEAVVRAEETETELILDIKGDGSGIFIGRKGSTLEAIQFLMTRMSQKQGWEGKRILVDSERYRMRRVDTLREKIERLAERVKQEGRSLRTEPLDAAMRKVVHAEIKNFPGLTTRSIGEGDFKRVQILQTGRRADSPRD